MVWTGSNSEDDYIVLPSRYSPIGLRLGLLGLLDSIKTLFNCNFIYKMTDFPLI